MDQLLERKIASKAVYEGVIINVRRDTVILPNGKEAMREVVEHPGAVAIVPVRDDGRVILVRQYRHAAGEILLEIPAGKLDKGEHPDDCARRELEEETGYAAANLRKLAAVFTTPGFSNEVIHIYLATGLTATAQHTDEDEFLSVVTFSREQLCQMLDKGELTDAKTALGLYMAEAVW